jgi:predicted transcriptional regulator
MRRKDSSSGKESSGRAGSSRLSIVSLRSLRESLGKTQGDVAREAGMTQPQLSRVEKRNDHLVSTLRKYLRAMGGEVAVVARVDGRDVILRDV